MGWGTDRSSFNPSNSNIIVFQQIFCKRIFRLNFKQAMPHSSDWRSFANLEKKMKIVLGDI